MAIIQPVGSFKDIGDSFSSLIHRSLGDKESLPLVGEQTKSLKDSLKTFIDCPAPNIIEWATRPEYLNFLIEEEETDKLRTVYDHWGQFETLRDFFELLCPICANEEDKICWGKSRETLESQPLLVWCKYLKDDQCPKCRTTRRELEEAGLFKRNELLLAIVGMRAGKSVTAAIISSWVEHKLLVCERPQKLFGQAPRQLLEVSFVATTGKQSEKTVFASWLGLREGSPWIQGYIKRLKASETLKGQYYDDGAKSLIKYNHINTGFESLTSNSSGQAGATRVAGFIDELARFDMTESKRSAKEVFNVINQGLKTVRATTRKKGVSNCFGILVATTSPIAINDFSFQLKGKASVLDRMYLVHKATWEFNPFQPRENFDEEFKRDPAGSLRDFGATPPYAESPYITDVESFKKCIDPNLKPTVTFEDVFIKDQSGRDYVGKKVKFCQTDGKTKRVIFGDAGKVRDTFTLVGAHGEYRDQEGKGMLWTTVIDFVVAIKPTITPKRIVNFDACENIIRDLIKKQRVEFLRFDRWNSESIIQSLNFDFNIDADNYQLRMDDYTTFLQDAYLGKVALLPPSPLDIGRDPYIDMSDEGRTIHELLALERSPDLKKVDHKNGEHNDLSCSIIGAHYIVQNLLPKDGGKGFVESRTKGSKNDIGAIGRFRRW